MLFQNSTPKSAYALALKEAKEKFERANKIMEDKNASDAEKVQADYIFAIHYQKDWANAQGDNDLSMSYYNKAAEKGHAGACYKLAKDYLLGNKFLNIEQDLDKVEHYTKLGLNNDTTAYDTPYHNQAEHRQMLQGILDAVKIMKERRAAASGGIH